MMMTMVAAAVVVTTQTMAYTKALVADKKEEEEDGEGTRVLFFSFVWTSLFSSLLFFSLFLFCYYLMKLGISGQKSECGTKASLVLVGVGVRG